MKKIFITDGNRNCKISENDTIPVGWIRGKTQKKGFKHTTIRSDTHKESLRKSAIGKFYITNGIENRQILKTDTIPPGWIRGMTRYRRMTNGVDTIRVLEKDIEYFKFIGWKTIDNKRRK